MGISMTVKKIFQFFLVFNMCLFVYTEDKELIKMVSIEKGVEYDNGVVVSDLYVSSSKITQSQFLKIMKYNPSNNGNNSLYPVTNINWYDAIEFCNELSKSEGYDPVYIISKRVPITGNPVKKAEISVIKESNGYRLPTSDEWKYLCYAGTNSKYFWGPEEDLETISKYVWIDTKLSHEVGQKPANKFGLYDLKGLGWEWCQNKPNNTGSTFVQMGGGYHPINGLDALRTNFLTGQYPETRSFDFTFRVVRNR